MTNASGAAGSDHRMRRRSVRRGRPGTATALVALLAACVAAAPGSSPARAQSLSAGSADCGGDAFSSAQVVEKRPPRRGPLTAMPDTLCADLAPQQPPVSVEIGVYPPVAPGRGGHGRGGHGGRAPY